MRLEERLAARDRYGRKLIELEGVNGVEAGQYGIIIQVEKRTPAVEKLVEEFLEREAPTLAYVIKETNSRTIRLPGTRKYDKIANP